MFPRKKIHYKQLYRQMCGLLPLESDSTPTVASCPVQRCPVQRCPVQRCSVQRCPVQRCSVQRCSVVRESDKKNFFKNEVS